MAKDLDPPDSQDADSPLHVAEERTDRRVLLVDMECDRLLDLREVLRPNATTVVASSFEEARLTLLSWKPDLLVANLHLWDFNALHLVYLAASQQLSTRSITYATSCSVGLARDLKAANAFFESTRTIAYALPAYVWAALPPRDRRDIARSSGRFPFGGRRRASDLPALLTGVK